ncbi:MAG: ATP phosphoribosyltransferase regulatory subunit [Cyanobacteria bacterium QS_7_48_42]|nr:MAG: ATP phosphoribosyltransferase regulatory subunit [Cyanobacteria bacterium QH_2_48_84]PSO70384.1 MAG: ATP phosphoribosyltransferase regulatory subunit [Cyanobacteria bacterium QS_1_48_34]PSO70977.1 MAG: ATP phosphoribosyltransferase regulatory subunit [Cyanobacteria bacterium QH_3_48_40]PSO83807.1 MAG: ATP phosphoribosyltransferase regulatory subunit [Cyanobacteria bacterium QS_3_48_167]PSO87635.1 MAG: ATP phosphoribosyltransferase regulatory subunit [Cyanobacteria bacterium QS_5_48_63]
MVHQPPAGARDWLPLEVAQKGWIADRLQQVFHRWGYQQIVTSTLEWLDTLMAGGAIQRSTVIQLQEAEEGTLGLRPELTASIARASVTRMAGNSYPQRLYYNANVFRRSPGYRGRQMEFYQAGVELLGTGGVLADAEILLLLADCLHQLGLQQWHVVLGEAGLTRSLLAPFPESEREQLRYCIAHLDRVTLESLPLSPQLRERALLLFDLRGHPADVLQQVASLDLDESAQQTVNNLKSLVELLEGSGLGTLPLILDLSLVQTFDYYTGIVFEVVAHTGTEARSVGQGGRYDQLLGVYHPHRKSAPGIGFVLNLEDLHTCLLSTHQLPQQTPASDWLVIPQSPQAEAAAFVYAQKLRNSQHLVRVEIDLGGRSPEQIREYARSCSITRLAWVQADGSPRIETL